MRRRIPLFLLTTLVLACTGTDGRYVGTWQSSFGGITLSLKKDKTAEFALMGEKRAGTWEVTGKNQIVVHNGGEDLTLTLDDRGALNSEGGTFVKQ